MKQNSPLDLISLGMLCTYIAGYVSAKVSRTSQGLYLYRRVGYQQSWAGIQKVCTYIAGQSISKGEQDFTRFVLMSQGMVSENMSWTSQSLYLHRRVWYTQRWAGLYKVCIYIAEYGIRKDKLDFTIFVLISKVWYQQRWAGLHKVLLGSNESKGVN